MERLGIKPAPVGVASITGGGLTRYTTILVPHILQFYILHAHEKKKKTAAEDLFFFSNLFLPLALCA